MRVDPSSTLSIAHGSRKRAAAHARRPRSSALVLALLFLAVSGCKKSQSDNGLGPDRDGDGWPAQLDCDDTDPNVYPAADDTPGDGIDQDCSGSDGIGIGGAGGGPALCEGAACGSGGAASGGSDASGGTGGGVLPRGADADGDGFAAAPDGEDCDDDRLEVYPGAPEIPLNGIDENCDGSDLVGAGQAVRPASLEAVPYEPPALSHSLFEGSDRFLLVWSDSRVAPGQDLYGQLVDSQGNPVGEEIEIETDDNHKKYDVTLASKGDGYLVSWVTSEGIWVRQLDALGVPTSLPLGFGPPGSIQPQAAFSDGHWAVTWKDGVDLTGWVRAMTEERARGDVLQLGQSAEFVVGNSSIVGLSSGFVVSFSGKISGDEPGVWLQHRALTGYPSADAVVGFEGSVGSPTLTWDGTQVWMAYHLTTSFQYVAATAFDSSLSGVSEQPIRLSTETLGIAHLRVAAGNNGFLAAWNDYRHQTHVPAAQAVYGNGITGNDDPKTIFTSSRALLVDSTVEFGGISVGENSSLIAALLDGEIVVLSGF